MIQNHEHGWTCHPPATMGAKGVDVCACGLFRDCSHAERSLTSAPASTVTVATAPR